MSGSVLWNLHPYRIRLSDLKEKGVSMNIEPIAHIETDLPEKFGLPRQSGLAEHLQGILVFEPPYRNMDALRGLTEFDYLWLLWQFEGIPEDSWSPTVRPPRLGGNTRMGVFATRSPFRPNPLGLSCVHLDSIENSSRGPLIHVSGIDLRDQTPIFDIKPYLNYVDAHPEARSGFGQEKLSYHLEVASTTLLEKLPIEKRQALLELLSQDPRPAYQKDPERIYGISYAGYNIQFQVQEHLLTIIQIEKNCHD